MCALTVFNQAEYNHWYININYTKTQFLPIVVLNPAQPVRQLRLESLQRGLVGDDRKDGAKQISTKIMVLY